MKGAIVLLLVLLMGLLTAQSFDSAFGYEAYTPTQRDSQLLSKISTKIDSLSHTQRDKLINIHTKLTNFTDFFEEGTQEHFLINAIYAHVDNVLYTPQKITPPTTTSTLPQGILEALGQQF